MFLLTIQVMKSGLYQNIDEYIAAAPDVAKAHLRALREVIESAVPKFEKDIGYGKPYYKYHGWVTGIDVYAKHIGLEIWDGLSSTERETLEQQGYKTGSKTFQVRYDQEVPKALVKNLVTAQVKRNEAKALGNKK